MAQVAVTINGRDYRISCDEGQEERLARLAKYVDERVQELMQGVGNVGDLRLLVMASLVISDKLFDTSSEVERLRAQVAQVKQSETPDEEAALTSLVDAIARRIDDIAAQIETT
ncbi:MAG: cell division protein ZapA [Alphaproteobacteria bacterium]